MSNSTDSEKITEQIKNIEDWRGALYQTLRDLINESAPELTEVWKRNTAFWKKEKDVCAIGVFKNHVKLNFLRGAFVDDPDGLFNAGFEAKNSRGIDFKSPEAINREAIARLIKRAAAL